MAEDPLTSDSRQPRDAGWLGAIGLPHLLRTLGFAVDPAKLGLAAAGIILTCLLGCGLDALWSLGDGRVPNDAIDQFAIAEFSDSTYAEPESDAETDVGIFELWRAHEARWVQTFLSLDAPLDGRRTAVREMSRGVRWMVRYHTVYFVLFAAGTLFIWSVVGGAICRMAAVQFARDEKSSASQAITYVKRSMFGGFFLAPCVPLGFCLITLAMLVVGGAVMRVPLVGDILGGAAFFLAIAGGFVAVALLASLLIGGSLLWPAVAAEGSDAFDAFSRSVSYVFSKPWKTLVYGVTATAYAAVCWTVVQWVTATSLSATRSAVGFGASWMAIEVGEESVSKIDRVWPSGAAGAFHAWPDWSQLSFHEYISAALVGLFVLLTIALMWGFLVSFYYCGSTVVYMLLRHDVDGTDLGDVYYEELPEPPAAGSPSQPQPQSQPPPAHPQGPAPTPPPAPVDIHVAAPSVTPAPTDSPKEKPKGEAEPETKPKAEPEPKAVQKNTGDGNDDPSPPQDDDATDDTAPKTD